MPKVIVVGAGWFGIAAAKTYLQVDPTVDLLILESASTLGGTWNPTRVYPSLVAQQPHGHYEYVDTPMPATNIPAHGYIPAGSIYSYMLSYTHTHNVYPHIRFSTTVTRIRRHPDGIRWCVWIADTEDPLECEQLIIATGLTDRPCIPVSLVSASFTRPWFHTREMGARVTSLTGADTATVTVYGGGKSAIDCVHLAVSAGKRVNWVIRTSGRGGVAFLAPATLRGAHAADTATTRLMSRVLMPTAVDTSSRVYWVFHSGANWLGWWVQWCVFWWIAWVVERVVGYERDANMRKLMPEVRDRAPFWLLQSLIVHRELYDWIREGEVLKIYRSDVEKLGDDDKVYLASGEVLQTDTFVFATGYEVDQPIFSPSDAASLGIPSKHPVHTDITTEWTTLEHAADKKVCAAFPRLAKSPADLSDCGFSGYRLHHTMVPLPLLSKNDRSLVFVGALTIVSTGAISNISALWAVAWLTGELNIEQPVQEAKEQVAFRNAFSRRRYLHMGSKSPNVLMEYLQFADELLKELGLKAKRKKGWKAELLDPYRPADYCGIVDEWKKLHSIGGKKEICDSSDDGEF